MSRPHWLLSFLPVIGGPLAFWLQNRGTLRRMLRGAARGYEVNGVGGALVGSVESVGQGTDLGAALLQVASDTATDPRLGKLLRDLSEDTNGPARNHLAGPPTA